MRETAARQKKTREGSEWARQNASPAHWLDDLLESYWEVVRIPYGEGLVGKKFPWSFIASCRSQGGAKNGIFFEFSLCLSRACLGKMIVLIYKWLKNAVFRR